MTGELLIASGVCWMLVVILNGTIREAVELLGLSLAIWALLRTVRGKDD